MPNPDRLARGQCCDLISDDGNGIRRWVCRDPDRKTPVESMEIWRNGQWVLVQDHGRKTDR